MAGEASSEKKGFDIQNLGMGVWIGIAVAALVIGVLIGRFVLGGGAGAAGALGKVTLTESELNTVVCTYAYNGTSQPITAREVIEQPATAANHLEKSAPRREVALVLLHVFSQNIDLFCQQGNLYFYGACVVRGTAEILCDFFDSGFL